MHRIAARLSLGAGLALLLAASPVSAQDTLPDPDCEEDPLQNGCDPECADPTVDCSHPPCPTDLAGMPPETGGVFMSFTLNSRSDIRVYRDTGDGTFEAIGYREFPSTRFLDLDTEPGVTYRYKVVAVGLDQRVNEPEQPAEVESPACGVLEVTTVPVFGSWPALGAAVLLSTIGYVWLRRR